MEKAVLVSRIEELDRAANRFDRLYFGVEFCEIKIPSPKEVKEALAFAGQNKMAFTLVTPYVTDRGLAAVERAVECLPTDGSVEVIANDFGVVKRVKEIRPDLSLAAGRVLIKQKRGFGVSAFQTDAEPALVEHWRSSGADTKAVRSFLTGLGITRVELDNLYQGISSDFMGSGLTASLYFPYGYITTTRYCPWAFDGTTWQNMLGRCGRACLQGMIKETGDMFSRELIIAGNAQFFDNEALPPEGVLLAKGFDRIIYEPGLPV